MKCPKCGFENNGTTTCVACGSLLQTSTEMSNLTQDVEGVTNSEENESVQEPPSKKNPILIIIIALVAIAGITFGVSNFKIKGSNEPKNDSNKQQENSNKKENTNNQSSNNENYKYFKDLTNDEKDGIVKMLKGSCSFESELPINKNYENFYSKGNLYVNRLLTFNCGEQKNYILDSWIYGMASNAEIDIPNYGGPTIADKDGHPLAVSNLNSSGEAKGNYPFEYHIVYQYPEFYKKDENTKERIYFTYCDYYKNVDSSELYIYYKSDNTKDNIYSLTTDENNKFARYKLETSNDTLKDMRVNITTTEASGDSIRVGVLINTFDKDKKGKNINDSNDNMIKVTSYRIEKYQDIDFLIINYKVYNKKENEDVSYFSDGVRNLNTVLKLVSDDELYYMPISINTKQNELYEANVEHEFVYALPNGYDLSKYYLTSRYRAALGYGGKTISLKDITQK